MRRTLLCLLLIVIVAGCSGPQEVERLDEWTQSENVRFRLSSQGCQVGSTEGLFPEDVSICSVTLMMQSSTAVTLEAGDQLFAYDDQEVAAYGMTLSRDPTAIATQGPAPPPGVALEEVSMAQGDEAVVSIYAQLPENQEPVTFTLDPGTDTSYLFELTR